MYTYRVFVKWACTFHKKSNFAKLEVGGKFEFHNEIAVIFTQFFPTHTLEYPPSRDGSKVQADFTNTL